jgi:hypothetical protein
MLRIGEHKIKRGCRKVEGLGLQLEGQLASGLCLLDSCEFREHSCGTTNKLAGKCIDIFSPLACVWLLRVLCWLGTAKDVAWQH